MTITINIPPDKSARGLHEFFTELVNGKLRPALNLDLRDRQALVDHIAVDEVDLQEDGVQIDYTVDWSIFSSCDDLRVAEDYSEAIFGKLDGDTWVFKKHVTPQRAAPNAEL